MLLGCASAPSNSFSSLSVPVHLHYKRNYKRKERAKSTKHTRRVKNPAFQGRVLALDMPSFPMYNRDMKTSPSAGNAQDYLKGGLSLLILATLRDGPRHGYGLARTIEQRTENALQLREGTLYPALHTLERDGLIQSAWETPPSGRERKVYTLTPSGRKKLIEWSAGWQQFVQAAQRVLSPAPQTSKGEPIHGTRSPNLRPAPGGSLS